MIIKYSFIEKEKYGMEYLVAYPDEYGVNTMDGLFDWESDDSTNRQVYFADNIEHSLKILEQL